MFIFQILFSYLFKPQNHRYNYLDTWLYFWQSFIFSGWHIK